MVIFHSYVSLPEGIRIHRSQSTEIVHRLGSLDWDMKSSEWETLGEHVFRHTNWSHWFCRSHTYACYIHIYIIMNNMYIYMCTNMCKYTHIYIYICIYNCIYIIYRDMIYGIEEKTQLPIMMVVSWYGCMTHCFVIGHLMQTMNINECYMSYPITGGLWQF
jgi:hypothetical protein